MNRVLIVGGAGYIGGALVNVLEKNGFINLAVYDDLMYIPQYFKEVKFFRGDVRDTAGLLQIADDYDTVVWLAAIVGDPACNMAGDDAVAINEKAPIEFAKQYKGKIIFMSTCSVYGANQVELTEESEVRPYSIYTKTKVNVEKFLIDRGNSVIFRLGTVHGLSDRHARFRTDLVVNIMTVNAILQNKITVNGGDQWRPHIHVFDVAKFIEKAITDFRPGIYNIATENMTIENVAKTVQEITGCDIETFEQNQDKRDYKVDTIKARRVGYVATDDEYINIQESAKEIAEILRQGRISDLKNPIFSNEQFFKAKNNEK